MDFLIFLKTPCSRLITRPCLPLSFPSHFSLSYHGWYYASPSSSSQLLWRRHWSWTPGRALRSSHFPRHGNGCGLVRPLVSPCRSNVSDAIELFRTARSSVPVCQTLGHQSCWIPFEASCSCLDSNKRAVVGCDYLDKILSGVFFSPPSRPVYSLSIYSEITRLTIDAGDRCSSNNNNNDDNNKYVGNRHPSSRDTVFTQTS